MCDLSLADRGTRVLPLMSDLYQMLCTTEVLKAVLSGLLRPKGQKFKVTAKGGDRSTQFIQWPLLRIFAFLRALTALGIANAFLIDQTHPLAESSYDRFLLELVQYRRPDARVLRVFRAAATSRWRAL